jgi:hypothetical protein
MNFAKFDVTDDDGEVFVNPAHVAYVRQTDLPNEVWIVFAASERSVRVKGNSDTVITKLLSAS